MRLIVILLSPLLVLFTNNIAYSQNLKKLRLAIGYGQTFGWPTYAAGEKPTSAVIYLEPSYRVNDRITLGWRMELASTALIPMTGGSSSSISSYGLNAQYYFSNKDFRPFVGAGIGIYKPFSNRGSSGPNGSNITNEKTVVGLYPRVGFDFHHLTLTIDYNFAPTSTTTVTTYEQNGQPPIVEQGELKNSYGSVKLGFVIGGGRK